MMRASQMGGVIDRRILVNYRIEPEVVAMQLPAPFRPKRVGGHAIGGFCLIHLQEIRPLGLPAVMGMSSENAALRFAVEWEDGSQLREGVYVPRRVTSSRLSQLLGGRVFPGIQRHARFEVQEGAGRYAVVIDSDGGDLDIEIEAEATSALPPGSVFDSLDEASEFFAHGALGYSDSRRPHTYESLELQAHDWRVQGLELGHLTSGYFDDRSRFPPGSIDFDSALLMRGIEHVWVAGAPLCVKASGVVGRTGAVEAAD